VNFLDGNSRNPYCDFIAKSKKVFTDEKKKEEQKKKFL